MFCYSTMTRAISKPVLTPSLSTRRRHWLVADVTAPIPCHRVWPVAVSTVCRHPVATPSFSGRRADSVNKSSSTRTSQPTPRRCLLRCLVTLHILTCLLTSLHKISCYIVIPRILHFLVINRHYLVYIVYFVIIIILSYIYWSLS